MNTRVSRRLLGFIALALSVLAWSALPAMAADQDVRIVRLSLPVDRLEIDSGRVEITAVLAARADFRIRDKAGSSFVLTQPARVRFNVGEKAASLAVMEGEIEAWNAGGYSLTRSGESYYYRKPKRAPHGLVRRSK